ncbi:unnamed protein product [Tenebrio molitor]|nr:unnamed protein product [Tenebrio molitor]
MRLLILALSLVTIFALAEGLSSQCVVDYRRRFPKERKIRHGDFMAPLSIKAKRHFFKSYGKFLRPYWYYSAYD